jgi:hypothetical protein
MYMNDLGHSDLLVVGGGPAGMAAAVSAARLGVKVTVVERWPMLGGLATMAAVNHWHTTDRQKPIIFGHTAELIERLEKYQAIQLHPHYPFYQDSHIFDPFILPIVYDDLVRELGIRVLCYTPCVDVQTDGEDPARRIAGVIVGTKRGLARLTADIYIDGSGDGDLAAFAHAPMVEGRESDGLKQGMTVVSSFCGVGREPERQAAIRDSHHRIWAMLRQLQSEGKMPASGGFSFNAYADIRRPANLMASASGDALDPDSITAATMDARRKVPQFVEFFRQHHPGCEQLAIDWIAPAIGVRETRRIRGSFVFTGQHITSAASFPDAIGHGAWGIDIHDPKGGGRTTYDHEAHKPPPGTNYQIPYRILLPDRLTNLLVVGRCASATHEGMAGLRVQTHCHVMGQAAGVAAAACLRQGVSPRDVPIGALQRQLVDQGVWIDLARAGASGSTPTRTGA